MLVLFKKRTSKSVHPPNHRQRVDDVRPEARLLREIGEWDVFPTGVTNGAASMGSSIGRASDS